MALLLAVVAVCGLALAAPAPAAADGPGGLVGKGIELECRVSTGMLGDLLRATKVVKGDMCHNVGVAVEKKVNKAWKSVWDSALGPIITSAADFARSALKKALTIALMGPSLNLNATGLWSGDATLAGMLTWLGLVIATFGLMWQIGKMAVTGQLRHAGRAASGWVENVVISALGVGLVALLLSAGDALTRGLVNGTFDTDNDALKRIVAVMVPATVANPITLLGVALVVLLVGGIQLVMIFLRQSAIPIQCLLLPVAGAGRVGGDATRQWAPKLITSICMVIFYKPILAVIICVGFVEFGSSTTPMEWLRGCATLVLAVLAPGPLMKIFAPFGQAVGGGMAGGGAVGALGGAVGYLSGKADKGSEEAGGGGGGGSDDGPPDAIRHAQMVSQTMGKQGGEGADGGRGQDVQQHASRADANTAQLADVPAQAGPEAAAGGAGGQGAGAAAGGSTGAAAAGPAAAAVVAIKVIDGVNQAVQDSAAEIGNGGNEQP
ncbi:hypothetical protein [Streptomyces xanthochromogenes]|uniref:hypothetical protein n=1 Tax=Streptomyces xanthochromogenes TaxID=67384 RepID=UPI0016737124|nr:hypothetical protein [Streptomyces xanthochromogenes]